MIKRGPLMGLLASFFLFTAVLAAPTDDYYNAGVSFYKKADYPNAIKYLKAAVQVDPTNWQANQVLGYCYYQTQDQTSALAAIDLSLQTHPENPSLRAFADRLRPANALPPPVTSATAPPPGSELSPSAPPSNKPDVELPTVFRKGFWANAHVGPYMASLGDFKSAVDAVHDNFTPSEVTASMTNIGVMVGGEAGTCFDNHSAFGLAMNVGFLSGYKDEFDFGANTGSDTFNLILGEFQLKYFYAIPLGTSRLRIGAGPGFYFSSVSANQVLNGETVLNGPMFGYGFGGGASLSWEIYVSKNVMISILAEGRFATIDRVKGDFQDSFGNTSELGLEIDSFGFLAPNYSSAIGTSGSRWAKLDLTGGDLCVGVSWHY